MAEVKFDFYGNIMIIQCNYEDKMKDIYKKYTTKIGKDVNELYFMYDGKKINNNNAKLEEIINDTNKNNNNMTILVQEYESKNSNTSSKSKEIICPECCDIALLNIKHYRINLFCCNKGHTTNNILLNQYESIQEIDQSKIKCENCEMNKSSTFQNSIYICNSCGINLCPLCKSKHDKNHYIVKYEDKYYICEKHNENFTEFCEICKKNLCPICIKEHKLHNGVNNLDLLNIIHDKEELQEDLFKLRKNIDLLKNIIEEIIKKLNNVKDNLDNFYKIFENIINNFERKNRNYYMLKNINKFKEYNEYIINDINKILNEYNLNTKFEMIMDIYGQMNNNLDHKKNHKFIEEPEKLKYKYDITDCNDYNGNNDIFDVFISSNDNEEYIASPNINNHNLDIFKLSENKNIFSLKGHNNNISTIRYFLDIKNFDEYLISADEDKMVIIWYITDNYRIKYKIDTEYGSGSGYNIYSCLLVFPNYGDDNYIITSTNGSSSDSNKSASKIYSLKSGKLIKKIEKTNNNNIFYLLDWYHKKNNKYYIIELAKKKIIITSLLDNELYSELMDEPDNEYKSGYIFTRNKKDYLCCSSSKGYIKIWDLEEKNIFKNIYVTDRLYHIIEWNNKYIIVADFNNKSFKIIDYEYKKIPINIKAQHKDNVKCVKKILHPLYGESLLTASRDKTIKLWSI